MSDIMGTYAMAEAAMRAGATVRRASWNECKVIRFHKLSDYEFIPVPSLDGFIIEDCKQRMCDCSIGVYQKAEDDEAATDWMKFEMA